MKRFENKTILVTGATGLIGSNIVHRLMQEDAATVVVLARNKEKILDIFADYTQKPNFKYIIQDIVDPIQSDEQFDYIFHAAGPIAGDAIRNRPVDVISANLQGTINCLEYLKKQGTGRMVVFSSATVYGNKTGTVTEQETELTDTLDSPICAYSQSKRMVETLARAYHAQHKVDVVMARFSYVFGYTKYYPNTALFNFIQTALHGDDIVLNSTSFAPRDNIYVEDAINMLWNVAEQGASGEAYNISSNGENGNFIGMDEMAQEIINSANQLTHLSTKLVKNPLADATRPAGMRMDNTKVKALSASAMTVRKISDAIYDTVHSYYNNRQNGRE